MGMREDVGSFEMGRLTLTGWLVFLLSVAAGIAVGVVAFSCLNAWFPPAPGAHAGRRGRSRIAGVFGLIGAVGFFFAAKGLLHLVGLETVRPKPEEIKNPYEV